MSSSATLCIQLRTPIAIRWRDDFQQPPARTDVQRLLAYLTSGAPSGYLSRAQLVADLWPDRAEEHGRKLLRNQLYWLKVYLRALTETEHWWSSSREWLTWQPELDVETDLSIFLRLADAALEDWSGSGAPGPGLSLARIRQAIEAMPESVLPGLSDPWVLNLRTRLQLSRLMVLQARTRAELEHGDRAAAASSARAWARAAKHSELAWRAAIVLTGAEEGAERALVIAAEFHEVLGVDAESSLSHRTRLAISASTSGDCRPAAELLAWHELDLSTAFGGAMRREHAVLADLTDGLG